MTLWGPWTGPRGRGLGSERIRGTVTFWESRTTGPLLLADTQGAGALAAQADLISSTVHGSFQEADRAPPATGGETEAQGGTATHPSHHSTEIQVLGSSLASCHLPTSETTARGSKGRPVGTAFPASWALGSNGRYRESRGWTHRGLSRMWEGALAAVYLKGTRVVGGEIPRISVPGIQAGSGHEFQGLGGGDA